MIDFQRVRVLLFASILMASALAVGADPRIDRIRALYQEAQKLECTAGCEHFQHTVTCNTMQPAIGLQTTTIRFYYLSEPADSEKDPYLLTYHLQKVKVTYNVAASVFYTSEYLYNETGVPVFIYHKDDSPLGSTERRYYFDAGSLIKAMVAGTDENGMPMRYDDVKNFRKDDVTAAASALKKAAAYKKFFEAVLAAEQLK